MEFRVNILKNDLKKVTAKIGTLKESMIKNQHRDSATTKKENEDKLREMLNEKEELESKLFRLTVFRASVTM